MRAVYSGFVLATLCVVCHVPREPAWFCSHLTRWTSIYFPSTQWNPIWLFDIVSSLKYIYNADSTCPSNLLVVEPIYIHSLVSIDRRLSSEDHIIRGFFMFVFVLYDRTDCELPLTHNGVSQTLLHYFVKQLEEQIERIFSCADRLSWMELRISRRKFGPEIALT